MPVALSNLQLPQLWKRWAPKSQKGQAAYAKHRLMGSRQWLHFFQPIHTIYSIVWKGLHWVVLSSKHARIRRLTECSGFAVVLNSMHERQKCSLGNISECHFNKCRVNVPWHLLSYFSVLARRTRRWCPFMPPPTAFWYIWPESSIQAT